MTMLRRLRRAETKEDTPSTVPPLIDEATLEGEAVVIPEHDPFMGYLLGVGGPVELDRVELDSPTVDRLRQGGVELVVPLISQGELIGTLNLGRRLSDQPYSSDDRKLLAGLAAQVAPAIRVAQLVRQQEADAKEHERIAQELRVASLIQQTLLPKEVPTLPGWEIDAYYRPAREVGGDFYDFIPLADGRLGLVIGDVTDKGVPAALVMATTRSNLRAASERSSDPGRVLAEVNEQLVGEIPDAMFVTCLYAVLDPSTGRLDYANAGQNLPYVRTSAGVVELRATGMPLGLMTGMDYEVKRAELSPGDTMVLTSDGIVEAHDANRRMFGFPRLMGLVAASGSGPVIPTLIHEVDRFSDASTEQEDDITVVSVRRVSSARASAETLLGPRTIAAFSLPSESGSERLAVAKMTEAVAPLGMEPERLERLETAVAEATMNAIEHGNLLDPSRSVDIEVLADAAAVTVRVRDQGGGHDIAEPETPDLEAKLAGEQSPRGWGLFLIQQMVDDLRIDTNEHHHTVELVMRLQGGQK